MFRVGQYVCMDPKRYRKVHPYVGFVTDVVESRVARGQVAFVLWPGCSESVPMKSIDLLLV